MTRIRTKTALAAVLIEICIFLPGCAYQSPGAKISVTTTTNASLSPANVMPTL